MEKIKETIKHIFDISLVGTIGYSFLMLLKLIAVSLLPFNFFVDVEHYRYEDRNSPTTDIIFVNKRTALFNIKADATREIYRADTAYQHPGIIFTEFTYDKSKNDDEITIPLPLEYEITRKGFYEVSESVNIYIPVWFLEIKKNKLFEEGVFEVK